MAHLTLEERQVISARLFGGETQQSIAEELGRSPATISRPRLRHEYQTPATFLGKHPKIAFQI